MAEGREEEALSVLLVDDNSTNLRILYQVLNGRGYRLLVARSGEDALAVARATTPALILLDIMMPGIDGFETCRRLKADTRTRDTAVIFVSAQSETKWKVEGLALGGADYVSKPFQPEELIARVETHLRIWRLERELRARNQDLEHQLRVVEANQLHARRRLQGPLLGSGSAVLELRREIDSLASAPEHLLLVSPPGAGEEAVARAVHLASARSGHAFIHVRGAELVSAAPLPARTRPDELANSFELAKEGTLFLEGVHLLPPTIQKELCRELEALESRPASGGGAATGAHVVASLVPGSRAVLEPRLSDLFATKAIHMPPLTQRLEDLPVLAHHFLKVHARTLDRPAEEISEGSLAQLNLHAWPGNVRELSTVIERAVLLSRGKIVNIERGMLEHGAPVGAYELIERIGRGGMGEVWRAKHRLLQRPAAVKLIRTDPQEDSARRALALRRFEREALATSRLQSSHTVELYDFGVSETGELFYVMELLTGLDLRKLVERFGPQSPARVVYLLSQACLSLSEAHELGLVHRDVKPANLFLCRLGLEFDVIKVLDFGIVRDQLDPQPAGERPLGTPAYLAPELMLPDAAPDARSDLYSLGSVAYSLLTGEDAYDTAELETSDVKLIDQVRGVCPKPPSGLSPHPIPARLDELILRCLAKTPSDRPASAREFCDVLEEAASDLERPWDAHQAESWWRTHLPQLCNPLGQEAAPPRTPNKAHTRAGTKG